MAPGVGPCNCRMHHSIAWCRLRTGLCRGARHSGPHLLQQVPDKPQRIVNRQFAFQIHPYKAEEDIYPLIDIILQNADLLFDKLVRN